MAHIKVVRRSMRPEEWTDLRFGWLKRYIYSSKWEITNLMIRDARQISEMEFEYYSDDYRPLNKGDMYFTPDGTAFIKADVDIPKELQGKELWFSLKTAAEICVKINGKYVGGVDPNRERMLLSPYIDDKKTLHFDMMGYNRSKPDDERNPESLSVRGCRQIFEGAYICTVNHKVQNLVWDFELLLDIAKSELFNEDYRNFLNKELNNAMNLIDFDSDELDGIDECQKYLDDVVFANDNYKGNGDVALIAHSHLDIAYYWRRIHAVQKNLRTVLIQLRLMDKYPDFKYTHTQPYVYETLEKYYPDVFEELKEKVKNGQFEPVGAMYVEPDCNIPTAESLVRQCLYGQQTYKRMFGKTVNNAWLPDVFGYSAALPQIMKKCGIDYFMTTKLAWNQFNKVPYDTMMWRGIDGTEVLTHLITTLGVSQPIKDYFTTYNGMLHPDAIMGGWMRYQNKDINNDILVSYGYGDGGGGPTREMLETSIRMEKGIKGIPKVRQEFSRTYFEELEERVKGDRRLPVWEGEFYFEYHRGTYTSMARNKRSNRKAELGLMDLELLSVLAQAQVAYPAEELDRMWKKVLINQFHDILPGSAIHEVYEVTKEEYAALQKEIKALEEERLHALVGDGEGITIFNTTGHDRSDIVELGEIHAEALKDAEGVLYPVQKTAEGAVVYVEHLPSKGYKTFAAVSGETEQKTPFVIVGDHTLETPFYTVHLDAEGRFDRIYDKENDREVLQDGKKGNQFRMYEDKPMCFDNWDVDIYYTEKYWDVNDVISMEWTECGPVRTTLEIERRESNSVIRQKIHFYADSRRIEFETYVDWKEHQTLLKVHFPVNVHTDEATFDVQFGNLTRKVHTNTSWDKARFESCGQKWIDLSEGHYGVSMLNDCKYGHSVKDSDMALTLIKSGIEPNPVADQEEHYFTYAIYPHAEKWQEAKTVEQAYDLNQPAIAVAGGKPGSLLSKASVDRSNVVLETIKCAESGHGIIIRMYESENALTKTNLVVEGNYNKAFVCNLLEEEEAELELKDGVVCVQLKPYEVVTVKLV